MGRSTRSITASTAVASLPQDLFDEAREALSALSTIADTELLSISFAAADGSVKHVHAPAALLARYVDAQMVPGRNLLLFDSDEEVTTEVAAQMLGVSRPHLVELLDIEAIPYRHVGNQRRIRVTEIEAFRQRKAARTAGMQKMADIINESESGWS